MMRILLMPHGNQSSDLRGMFLGLLRKKSLGEIFFKNGLWPEINHRILDGIYTETKSLEELN